MICRGGTIADSRLKSGVASVPFEKASEESSTAFPGVRTITIAVMVVSLALWALPGRTRIAPLVESDYCYQLIAVERASQGLGFTSLQPAAPRQAWDWQYDFGFLTQWPVGYPVLVWMTRTLFGISSVTACQWIAVLATSAALVGWFIWIRGSLPRRGIGTLLAALGAAVSVSVPRLLNPSTDAIVIATVPFVLMLVAMELREEPVECGASRPALNVRILALAGLMAGTLCWIRYGAVFLVVGVCAYLVHVAWQRRVIRGLVAFGLSAAIPIGALLVTNRMLGSPNAVQDQLNLGKSIGFSLSAWDFATMWSTFTRLRLFDRVPGAGWFWALLPVVVWGGALVHPRCRQRVMALWSNPQIAMSAYVVGALLFMLLTATALFSAKYHYVALDRYYFPVRPLYFLLFLSPLLLIRRPIVYVPIVLTLIVCCGWVMGSEWIAPYNRSARLSAEVTSFGRRAVAFTPGAEDLYQWIRSQPSNDLVIFSNFQDDITLETNRPASPIPPSRAALDRWVAGIASFRGITQPRVLVIVDPDNRWRSYFLPSWQDAVESLGLDLKSATAIGNTRIFQFAG